MSLKVFAFLLLSFQAVNGDCPLSHYPRSTVIGTHCFIKAISMHRLTMRKNSITKVSVFHILLKSPSSKATLMLPLPSSRFPLSPTIVLTSTSSTNLAKIKTRSSLEFGFQMNKTGGNIWDLAFWLPIQSYSRWTVSKQMSFLKDWKRGAMESTGAFPISKIIQLKSWLKFL